jgi:glycosyltransferase involved in cell wall biosynthesis
MHINVCTVDSGWILQKIGERIVNNYNGNEANFTITKGCPPMPNVLADVNYYVDIQSCFFGRKTKCDIGFFTHADMNSKDWLFNILRNQGCFGGLDGIVSMNERYTQMLREVGFPGEKLITLTPGQTYDYFPLKKIKIGIVSRGGYTGLGHDFLEGFFKNHNTKNFEFYFLGGGWEPLLEIPEIVENTNIYIETNEDYSYYPKFYNKIDYLLIPGMWTAGPMSMQEALSTGVPVIGANVGFVNYEFQADYVFEPGDESGLDNILRSIENPVVARRSQVENMTWANHADDLVQFTKRLRK